MKPLLKGMHEGPLAHFGVVGLIAEGNLPDLSRRAIHRMPINGPTGWARFRRGKAFIEHDPRLGCAGAVFVFCNRLGGNTTSLAELHYWQGGRYRAFGAYLPKPRYSAVAALGVRPQRQGRRSVKLRIVKDDHKHSTISCPDFLRRGSGAR